VSILLIVAVVGMSIMLALALGGLMYWISRSKQPPDES
jgi:hypothetical protein